MRERGGLDMVVEATEVASAVVKLLRVLHGTANRGSIVDAPPPTAAEVGADADYTRSRRIDRPQVRLGDGTADDTGFASTRAATSATSELTSRRSHQ